MNPILQRVNDSSSESFARCLEILSEAIPPAEQLPLDRLTRLLAGGDYRLYSFSLEDEIVATALLYLPESRPFAWGDYMAIRAGRRSQGLGSRLFQELVKLGNQKKVPADWFLGEVDDDREGAEEVRLLNRRRIEFYRRLGAYLLANVPYRFPSATAAPVPMRLIAYPLRPGATISPEFLRATLEDVFLHVHGRGKEDPLLQWIVNLLPSALILE